MPPSRRDWPDLLDELTRQLQTGRVYDRDLDELTLRMAAVNAELTRRMVVRRQTTSRRR